MLSDLRMRFLLIKKKCYRTFVLHKENTKIAQGFKFMPHVLDFQIIWPLTHDLLHKSCFSDLSSIYKC
jgi:hypothetical protein